MPQHMTSFSLMREEKKKGSKRVDWPANSPDFNPIEHIWTLMKSRIQTHHGHEQITSLPQMKLVLQEEWNKITIEEINKEVNKISSIIAKCININ